MQDRNSVYGLFVKAALSGGRQLSPFEMEWELHGDCLLPVRREVYCRAGQPVRLRVQRKVSPEWATSDFPFDWLPGTVVREFGAEKRGPYVVYLTVRCRMCDNCRRARQRLWAARAADEIKAAARTWLLTLTCSPQWHSYFYALAAKKTVDIDYRPLDEQFHLRHAEIGIEVTKLFKRLRKKGAQFRYLMVVEPHLGKRSTDAASGENVGLPHYHILLHEIGAPIGKRALQAEWKFGFTTAKLVDARGAWYVAKYLSKNLAVRVRASAKYGSAGVRLGGRGRGSGCEPVGLSVHFPVDNSPPKRKGP